MYCRVTVGVPSVVLEKSASVGAGIDGLQVDEELLETRPALCLAVAKVCDRSLSHSYKHRAVTRERQAVTPAASS